MDFGSGREDFCEDEANLIRGKLLFPSSSSYPSQSQYTRGLVAPFSNGQNYSYQHHNHHNQRGWLENRFEASPQEESSGRVLELMEVSQAANNEHDEDAMRRADSSQALAGNTSGIEKEHMFDKVVTPSDVGKLNRLVIPKQHAEKYFPLDSSTNEKGLLLNFEDRSGKPWRFRYSYWNSSQSYVMTKGWSRFVKEKKLDAGDIVSFQRGVGELGKDRLYIDWRRRPNAPDTTSFPTLSSLPHNLPFHRAIPWNPMFLRPPPQMGDAPSVSMATAHLPQQSNMNYHLNRNNGYYYSNAVGPCHPGSVIYLRSAAAVVPQEEVRLVQVREGGGSGGTGVEPVVFDSVPVVHGKAAAKRLRLFGVNMECPIPESDECDTFSSSTTMAANNSTMVCQLPNQLSSSSSPFPPLVQSRLYNGIPLQTELLNKGKSSMSFDLDI